jgi:YihY family inner membrane protein
MTHGVSDKLVWLWLHTCKTCREFLSHYIGGLYNRIADHHDFLLAGGLSFSIIVCILPMVLIVFAVIGSILEEPSIAEEINSFIDRTIPYEEYAQNIKDIVLSRMDEFKIYKSVAGLIGMLGLLIASSGLFSSMRTILNTVYRVKTVPSAYLGKLRDIGLVLLVVIYFLLSTTVLPTLGIIEDLADRFEAFSGFTFLNLSDFAHEAALFLVILVAFFVLYFFMPQRRLPRMALVSAVVAAVLWKAAEYLFGYYITSVATLKRIYGAYSLTIVVAFWIYYTSLVFIIAAEIGQLFRERREKKLGIS